MANKNLRRITYPRSRSQGAPEGPYEYENFNPRPGIANSEMETFLNFYEKFENEMESLLTLKGGHGDTRILSKLIRDHLSGKTSTKSSLIASSGMSYGTALLSLIHISEPTRPY